MLKQSVHGTQVYTFVFTETHFSSHCFGVGKGHFLQVRPQVWFWSCFCSAMFGKHIERPRDNSVLLKGEFLRGQCISTSIRVTASQVHTLVTVTPTLQTSFACLWLVGFFQQQKWPLLHLSDFNGAVYVWQLQLLQKLFKKPHQFSTGDLHTVWIGGAIKSCMSLATLISTVSVLAGDWWSSVCHHSLSLCLYHTATRAALPPATGAVYSDYA